MKLTKIHIINSLSVLVLGFLFLSDAMVLVNFNKTEKSNCCGAECHCKVDNQCEMSINCGTTHVVLLIPLVNLEKYKLDIFEQSEVYTDNINFNFVEKEYKIFQPQNNPVLKPPLNSINPPLLI